MTIRGWVSVKKNGSVRWYRNLTGDYREIPFCATKKMAEQLWAGTIRRATFIIEPERRRGMVPE